jgi:hypothetical protein
MTLDKKKGSRSPFFFFRISDLTRTVKKANKKANPSKKLRQAFLIIFSVFTH